MRCSFSRRRMRFGQSVVEVAVIAALASAIVALASCAIGGRKGDEHGEGVHGIQDDSRAALDAQHLEYFYKQLSLALQDGGEMKLHRHYKEEGRSADLLQWLVRKEIIRAKDAQRLSGASGEAASEEEWRSAERSIDTKSACIFTCPNTGPGFARRATSRRKRDGIFMCLNRHFYDTYSKSGMVLVVAGEHSTRVAKFADIPELFEDKAATYAIPSSKDESFYGKHPFSGIAPE